MFWMFTLPYIIILLKVYRFTVFVACYDTASFLTSMVSQGTFFLQYWQGVGLFKQSEDACKLRSPFVICSPQPWLQSRSLLGHSSTCFCKKYVCLRSNIRNAHDAAMRRLFLIIQPYTYFHVKQHSIPSATVRAVYPQNLNFLWTTNVITNL